MTAEACCTGNRVIGAVHVSADVEITVYFLVVCGSAFSIAVEGTAQRSHIGSGRIAGLPDRSKVSLCKVVNRTAAPAGYGRPVQGIVQITRRICIEIVETGDAGQLQLLKRRQRRHVGIIVADDLDIVFRAADCRIGRGHDTIHKVRTIGDHNGCLAAADHAGDRCLRVLNILGKSLHCDRIGICKSRFDIAELFFHSDVRSIFVDTAVLQVVGDSRDGLAGQACAVKIGPVPAQGCLAPDILHMAQHIIAAVCCQDNTCHDRIVIDLVRFHIQGQVCVMAAIGEIRTGDLRRLCAVLYSREAVASGAAGQGLVIGRLLAQNVESIAAGRKQEILTGNFLCGRRALAGRHGNGRCIRIRDLCHTLQDTQVFDKDRIDHAQDLCAADRIRCFIACMVGTACHVLVIGLDRRRGDDVHAVNSLCFKEIRIRDVHQDIALTGKISV